MRLPHRILPEGTVLYHGTSVAEPFEQNGAPPTAPAWFSTVLRVAQSFIDWRGNWKDEYGPCPRVLMYYLTRDIPRMAVGELQEVLQVFGRDTPAQTCCKQWNGWIMPDQYRSPDQYQSTVPTGDDIMLCDTSALKFVKRICL